MGEEGVVQCRSLLDGLDGQGEGGSSYLQHIISEGRCVVCNHSTFEEDMLQQQAASRNGEHCSLVCCISVCFHCGPTVVFVLQRHTAFVLVDHHTKMCKLPHNF